MYQQREEEGFIRWRREPKLSELSPMRFWHRDTAEPAKFARRNWMERGGHVWRRNKESRQPTSTFIFQEIESREDGNGDKQGGNGEGNDGNQGKDGNDGNSNGQNNGDENHSSSKTTVSSSTTTTSTSASTSTFQTPKQQDKDSSTKTTSSSTSSTKTSKTTSITTSAKSDESHDNQSLDDSNKDSSPTTTTSTTRSSELSTTTTTTASSSSAASQSSDNSDNGSSNARPKNQGTPGSPAAAAATPFGEQTNSPSESISPISSLLIDTSTGNLNPTGPPIFTMSSIPTRSPATFSGSDGATNMSSIPLPTKATAAAQPAQTSSASSSSGAPSMNSALIAGATVGAIAGFVLLVALSVLCLRGKLRPSKLSPIPIPNFRSTSPWAPASPPYEEQTPSLRTMFPAATAGLVPERPRARSLPPLDTEKTMESEVESAPTSKSFASSKPEMTQEEASYIDPGFMRDISTIMEESSVFSDTRRSQSHQSQSMSYQSMSYMEPAPGRQSTILSASVKSNSTIVLPAPLPNHSLHSSESGSIFAPTRINSLVGPWRDSLWSTTATPTGVVAPPSAYASQRQSRRSLSMSARLAEARDSTNWFDETSPRSSGRLQRSMILPPLPTPGFGSSLVDQNTKEQGNKGQPPSRLGGFMGSPWPLK